jgi:hypothetical protein
VKIAIVVVAAVVAVAAIVAVGASCLYSQSANCGEAYDRHLVRWQDGRYRFAQPVAAGDPLAGVQALTLARDGDGHALTITTDDGRSARYRVLY